MERSEQLNELATALTKAQGEFPTIPKTSDNPFFKSKYAALPVVKALADPIITKNGLVVSQTLGHNEGGDTLTTILLHTSGQFIQDTMRLHLTKNDSQGQGSATTYARRFSYMSILGLVADEDDDGAKAAPRQNSGNVRQTQVRRPTETKPRKQADPSTGEIQESIAAVLAKLDEQGLKAVEEQMEKANFPAIDKLPDAAAKLVRRWADVEVKRMEKERDF